MAQSVQRATALPDLAAIEAALRDVQRDFPRLSATLRPARDPLDDEVIANLLIGYQGVGSLLQQGVDILAMGNLKRLLDLNRIVLCGTDPEKLAASRDHLDATEKRFYDEADAGIGDVVEWYRRHREDSIWKRAAGVYIRILSAPQLFVEGNHRTGALVMSYLLMREGKPPFVLTVENARAYFDPSSVIRNLHKHSVQMLVRIPHIKKKFAEFLERNADHRFLLPCGADGRDNDTSPPMYTALSR